ncbi:MAG: hypothetical protein E7369_01005 [Clostridiales bacterium]|nr:hypothetical protein [Clostridiales bacterium]
MGFIGDVAKVFSGSVFEIVALSCIFVYSVFQTVLSVRGNNRLCGKPKLALVTGIALLSISSAFYIKDIYGGLGSVALFLAVGCVTDVFPAVFMGKVKVKKEEKEFIDYIDKEIKKQDESPYVTKEEKPTFNGQVLSRLTVKDKPEIKQSPVTDIDFTHVKNVIERISYYNLNSTDKRTLSELSSAVIEAETVGLTPPLKGKINDYLGALLKIMSKYNV